MAILRDIGTAALATVRVPGARSTTGKRLRLQRGWLLVLTAIVLGTSVTVFTGVQNTVDEIRTQAASAVVGSAAAYEGLVRAHDAAVRAFQDGRAELTWPGEEYQTQVGTVSQSLAQVAEHNVAGPDSSRDLQLVQGLLVSYTTWMAQAETRYRTAGPSLPAATNVWYASSLLHRDNGILPHLERLRMAQQEALRARLSSGWPVTLVAWAVPVALLAALLVYAQRYHRDTFRRRTNPPLIAAAVLLAGVTALTALSVPSLLRAHQAADVLQHDLAQWQGRAESAAASNRLAVARLVTEQCEPIGCGDTVRRFAAAAASGDRTVVSLDDDGQLAATGDEVDDLLADAQWPAALQWLIVGGSVLVAALVVTGYQGRIDEYRFHRREGG